MNFTLKFLVRRANQLKKLKKRLKKQTSIGVEINGYIIPHKKKRKSINCKVANKISKKYLKIIKSNKK